jgi:hypothetical protein
MTDEDQRREENRIKPVSVCACDGCHHFKIKPGPSVSEARP